ncbi:hypothetical protein [uncultured Pseudacidovorax sp.]|uniref:hypothetical protein n=1 Tax=uncultured Pseudacidovorax sp. TaxID=679313 RepID=UPI0025D9CFB9|nr:hypothetical protein [uncultured Pseudacidovorax sp.]
MSGLPRRLVRGWQHRIQPADGYSAEGQSVVMVAIHQREPVGFFGGSVEVIVHDDDREVYLVVAADMVYVVPRYRGQGFSMDLSVATGIMLRELLQAVYRAAAPHSEVNVILRADIHTTGGDYFAGKLAESLGYELEVLKEEGRRRTIRIGSFDFEGGW